MTPPKKPDPARRQMFARSFALSMALVAAVALIGYYGARGDIPFLAEEAVVVSVEAPTSVVMRDGTPTAFNVSVTIENRTSNEVILEATNPCNTVRWLILAGGDAFVQAKEETECLGTTSKDVLEPGASLKTSFTITLDLRRSLYQPEGKYQLLVEYWGIQADDGRPQQFELVR